MALFEPPDQAWDRVEELLELALLLADRHDLDAFFASRLVGWRIKGNFCLGSLCQLVAWLLKAGFKAMEPGADQPSSCTCRPSATS